MEKSESESKSPNSEMPTSDKIKMEKTESESKSPNSEMPTSDKIKMEKSESESKSPNSEMPTSDKIKKEKCESDSNSPNSERPKSDKTGGRSSTRTKKKAASTLGNDTVEYTKFLIWEYFKQFPVTDEEKKVDSTELHHQIYLQHQKCVKLQELALSNTGAYKLMKKSESVGQELNPKFSLQMLTNAAQSLLCEYGICIHSDSLRREKEAYEIQDEIEQERFLKTLDSAHIVPYTVDDLKITEDDCPIAICIYDLFMCHEIARSDEHEVRIRIREQAYLTRISNEKKVKDENTISDLRDEGENEKNVENRGTPTKVTIRGIKFNKDLRERIAAIRKKFYYRVILDEEILHHRINFLQAVDQMVRMGLRLFRRIEGEWLKSGETYVERIYSRVSPEVKDMYHKMTTRDIDTMFDSDSDSDDTCRTETAASAEKAKCEKAKWDAILKERNADPDAFKKCVDKVKRLVRMVLESQLSALSVPGGSAPASVPEAS